MSDDESQTLGERTLRIVMTEREDSDGALSRTGKIITPIDENHVLVVQVKVAAGSSADFDAIFQAALTSLTITP